MFCNFLSFLTFLFVSGWRIVPLGSLSFLSIPATVISFLTFLGDIYLLHCRQLILRGRISAFRLANFIFLVLPVPNYLAYSLNLLYMSVAASATFIPAYNAGCMAPITISPANVSDSLLSYRD